MWYIFCATTAVAFRKIGWPRGPTAPRGALKYETIVLMAVGPFTALYISERRYRSSPTRFCTRSLCFSLKHWGVNKMADILRTSLDNATFIENYWYFEYFTDGCSWCSYWRCVSIGSSIGLVPNVMKIGVHKMIHYTNDLKSINLNK